MDRPVDGVSGRLAHHVLVDAHNAIHRLRVRGRDIEAMRAVIVARVRTIMPRGATVHFDGHPPAGAFGGTEDRGVTIRYSGSAEADDAILEELRATRTPGRYTVVTDDLELARRAEQLGAASVRIRHFFTEPAGHPRVQESHARARPTGDAFRPSDFDLPEIVDLTKAFENLDNQALPSLPRRTARGPRRI